MRHHFRFPSPTRIVQKKFLCSTFIKPGFLMMLAIVVIVYNLAFKLLITAIP